MSALMLNLTCEQIMGNICHFKSLQLAADLSYAAQNCGKTKSEPP